MIIGIIGERGSGKTLIMAKDLKEENSKGKIIYSNFHINSKAVKYPKNLNLIDEKFLKEYSNFKLYNCCVYLDEIYIYIDSRVSGSSKRNRIFSYFINQTRKRNVSLIYSAQLLNSVDLRLRRQTEIFILPKCIVLDGEKVIVADIVKPVGFSDQIKKIGEMRFLAKDYYDVYDTDEIISFDNI